ncbi:MAG: SCO family protein [Alphaproteobacteria bacterium]
MKNRFIRWVFLLIIGFGIGAGITYLKAKKELGGGVISLSPDDNSAATILKKPVNMNDEAVVGSSDIGGSFTLVDQDGNEVTDADYDDTYKLVFFGFTFCPAICPAELQKFALIMDNLGEDADKITPIFITVDPERDTAGVMKAYVEQFHPALIGLTGSQEQIDAVKNAFKVYASKVENEMMDEYMMDHSSFTYLMDKNNKLIAMYPSKDSAEKIVEDIKKKGL